MSHCKTFGIACAFYLALLIVPLSAQADVLADLIQSSVRTHPAVVAGRAQQKAADADVEAAKWQFYPTVSVGVEAVSAAATDPNYAGADHVSTFRVQQPLWTGGRLTSSLNKAQASTDLARATLTEVRQSLALQVVQAYGDWLGAHLKLQAQDKSLKELTRLGEQIARRVEQGVGAAVDQTLATSRIDALVAEIASVQAQKRIALTRLKQLTGAAVDDSQLVNSLAKAHAVGAAEDVVKRQSQAEAISPAVLKARAQVKVQEALLGERKADLYPELNLRLERQFGNYSSASGRSDTRVFLTLSSRLGAGLSSWSSADSAEASLQAALFQVDEQLLSLGTQLQTDAALSSQLVARIATLRASQVSVQQVFESYSRQYLAGRKSWLEVMNASREIAQGEVQLAEALASQVVVTWRLAIVALGLDDAVQYKVTNP